jgi:hypothetical protein
METEYMRGFTRRHTARLSLGATIAGAAACRPVNAADGDSSMSIERHGITEPVGDIPIISLATVHGGIVYLCGVTADPVHLGDMGQQR